MLKIELPQNLLNSNRLGGNNRSLCNILENVGLKGELWQRSRNADAG